MKKMIIFFIMILYVDNTYVLGVNKKPEGEKTNHSENNVFLDIDSKPMQKQDSQDKDIKKQQELQEFKRECNSNEQEDKNKELCALIVDLEQALLVLEDIQKYNLSILKEKSKKEEIKEREIKYTTLHEKEIKVVTQEEHAALEEYMKRFCHNFETLENEDKKILFTLSWNKTLLFENEKKVNKFCKKID